MNAKISTFFVLACVLYPGLASAAEYIIQKGQNVSQIVMSITGSPNYTKDGIRVITDKGRVISRAKFDHVRPDWKVVVDDKLAKTVRVEGSAGKTLAQVCTGSIDQRCALKLAKLNSIITSRTSKRTVASRLSRKLTDDVYAFPGLLVSVPAVPAHISPAPAAVALPKIKDPLPSGQVPVQNTTLASVIPAVVEASRNPPPQSFYRRLRHRISNLLYSSSFWTSSFLLIPVGFILLGFFVWPVYTRRRTKLQALAKQSRLARTESREQQFYEDFKPEFGKRRILERHKLDVSIRRNPFEIGVKGLNCRFPNLEDQYDGTIREIDRVGKVLAVNHPHFRFGQPRMEDGVLYIPVNQEQEIVRDDFPVEV